MPKATFFAFCSVHICIAVCSCGGRCSDFQRIFCSAPQGLCFQFSKLIIRKVDHTPPYLHCKSITKRTNFTFFFFFIFTDDCFWQVSCSSSGVLSCSFSACQYYPACQILERNLVELENIILWKTLEQNP